MSPKIFGNRSKDYTVRNQGWFVVVCDIVLMITQRETEHMSKTPTHRNAHKCVGCQAWFCITKGCFPVFLIEILLR